MRAYGELHRQYVLGPAVVGRRTRIMGDARVAQLRDLAAIDILGNAERDGWMVAISGIRTCREFHEGMLADAPTCRCGFRPVHAAGGQTASRQLELLDQRLGIILAQWHAALADALRSDTARHSIAAMTSQERQPTCRPGPGRQPGPARHRHRQPECRRDGRGAQGRRVALHRGATEPAIHQPCGRGHEPQ